MRGASPRAVAVSVRSAKGGGSDTAPGTRRLVLGALLLAWLIIQLGLVHSFGVRGGNDTGRYLHAAQELLSGVLPSGKAASYLGYDAFVAAFLALGLGMKSIAAAQSLIALAALLLLYRLGTLLYDERVGLSAMALLVFFPDTSYWHSIVLTDSLYSSMVIIAIFLMVSAATPARLLAALIAFCFTCTIRPHGVGLALSGMLFLLCRLLAARRYGVIAAIVLGILAAALPAWSVLGHMMGHEDILHHYIEGTVIWGYSPADIPAPSGLDPTDFTRHRHPLAAVLLYIVSEPAHFLILAGHKLWYFFGHVRPYFASYHNLLSLAVLAPAYALAITLLIRARVAGCGGMLLVCTLAAQAAIVAFTFADWDARHLLPVVPIVFLLAAAGLWDTVDRIRRPPA